MSRTPQLEPAWLVGLLLEWSRRNTINAGLGYYRVNPMLKDGIPNPARSYEPTGYGGMDIADVDKAMSELARRHEMRAVAIMRFLRPWRAKALDIEYHISHQAWMAHLKAGLSEIATSLRPKRKLVAIVRRVGYSVEI